MKTEKNIPVKKNPYSVPDGYFESLTERTMSAIRETGVAASGHEAVRRSLNLRPFIALAAAIIGIAVITTLMLRLASGRGDSLLKGPDSEIFADLYMEEIDAYLLEDEWVSAGNTGIETGGEIPASSDEIIDYLVKENIDVDDIYELL